jgi:hypothetical protein
MKMNCAKVIRLAAIMICLCGLRAAQAQSLAVVDEPLPAIEAGVQFEVQLHATGGVAPYLWSVASGELPEGITLSPKGLLYGRPARPGILALTLKVDDSSRPPHSINKEFHAAVGASLLFEWIEPPKVHDDRIDGTLQVSNGSKDTFDMTVYVVAIADNGRATAIGYEHFPLKAGTTSVKIPFGNTLPHGPYVVHADAIAEIANKNTILRRSLQTPQPLQVVVGP